jgi:hypothetical protein
VLSQPAAAQTVTTLPVVVGKSETSTRAAIDPVKGSVTDSVSIVRGLTIGAVHIDSVSAHTTCRAHGRTGTASCDFSRVVAGVTLPGAPHTPACTQSFSATGRVDTCASLLGALNALYPPYLSFAMPWPDTRPDYAGGSPGGYQAVSQKDLYENLQDTFINYDASHEIPGLRVLYVNDNPRSPSRVDLQLANVQAESHYGITRLGAGSGAAFASPPPEGSSSLLTAPAGGEVGMPSIATSGANSKGTSIPAGSRGGGLPQVLERLFTGLKWLVRSPGAAMGVGVVLSMLFAPLLLAQRRRKLQLLAEVPS